MVGSDVCSLNPYQVLALSTRASSRDIRRRFDELKVRIDLGLEPALEEETIRSARQALDDPVQRVRHQWFWRLAEPPLVGPGIDFSNIQSVRQAVGVLDATATRTGLDADLARHDAAIVRLKMLEVHPESPVNLDRMFADSTAAVRSDRLWALLALIGDANQDPRVRAEIERFRTVASEELLDRAVSALTSVSLSEDRLADVLTAIKQSGAPRDRINAAAARLLNPIEALLTTALARFDKDWNTLTPEEVGEPTQQERQTLDRLRHLAESELLPQAKRLYSLAQNDFAIAALDNVADRLAALSFGVLVALKDGWRALFLIGEAAKISSSPKMQKGIEANRARLLGQVYELEMVQSLEANDWPLVLAYIDLIAASPDRSDNAEMSNLAAGIRSRRNPSLASVNEAKDYIRRRVADPSQPIHRHVMPQRSSEPTVPRQRRRVWPWLVGLGAAAIVLISFLGGNGGANPNSGRNGATSIPNSGRVIATSTPSCRLQLAKYEDQLDALDPQISNVQSTMVAVEAQIAPHATEIAWIETNYPSMVLPPELFDRYQYVAGEYNAGAARWRRLDTDENRMIGTYNRTVDQHNELRERC